MMNKWGVTEDEIGLTQPVGGGFSAEKDNFTIQKPGIALKSGWVSLS